MMADAIDLNLGRHAVALARKEWGPRALEPIGPHLSALLPLMPESGRIRRWHPIQTLPRQEFNVAKAVRDSGFDAWCPKVPCKVRVRGEHYRKVERPMLTGYVLAGFDPDHEVWEVIRGTQTLHGQRIEGMRGVIRLLMIDLKPVPLGDKEVARLEYQEADQATGNPGKYGAVKLELDTMVRVLTGPFAHFMGFVIEIDYKKNEATVELNIFNRPTRVTLEFGQVEPV